MKISKVLIKTIAIAVTVSATTSCAIVEKIEQKIETRKMQKLGDSCPGCGMG